MKTDFKNLIDLMDYFKDEEICKAYLVHQRWSDKPSCPHCGSAKVPYVTTRGYKCSDNDCYKKFTVITGTPFENTKIGLRYWFAAIYLASAHKKGISSLQLSRDLQVTQKTAWFMLHRIREIFKGTTAELTGVVEVDETYVGGKTANKHKKERDIRNAAGTGAYHQKPVIAMVQRDGLVITKVIDRTVGSVVKPIINTHISKDAIVITDGHGAYAGVKKTHNHSIVNHEKGEFARGMFHTNTVEGYFSLLKRGIIGIYHYVSPKHLHRYCDEFSYRYNTRKTTDCERFSDVLTICNGRLKYKDLIK